MTGEPVTSAVGAPEDEGEPATDPGIRVTPPGGLLHGVVILDLTRHLPGPLAVRLLRDLGARTIKVEEPREGDPVRAAPPFRADDTSALAHFLLAGAESVAVDLRRAEGVELVSVLAEQVDVVIESSRPGALARLGLDLAAIRARSPALVVCSLSGWGATGWLPQRSGHDLTYQAAAGLLGDSTPRAPVADVLAAWVAVSSILAALFRARQSGEGATIDLGVADAAAHANLVSWSEMSANDGRTVGLLAGRMPCYRLYRARDGRSLALAALEVGFWESLCRALGRPDLRSLQYDSRPAAHRELEAIFARRQAREWIEELRAIDVPIELVASPEEALAHPWMVERGLVRADRGGDGGAIAFPARFDGQALVSSGPVPDLGETGRGILEEWVGDPVERRRLARAEGPRRSLLGWVGRWWFRRRSRSALR